MSEPPITVTLYAKPGCHLCDDVADHLEDLAARRPLDITTVDITGDLELHRRFWDKIPVVAIGAQLLQAPISRAALEAALAAQPGKGA